MLKGVTDVAPGYAGGKTTNPTYQQVCGGDSGHAEVIKIEFDPSQVSYRDLLTVFFGSHDATQLNRQGNDVGTQYRSVVFPTTPGQKEEVAAFITELSESSKEGDPIVTTIEEGATFYPAEEYHKDYYAQNKAQGYCQVIIAPKLQKVQEKYAQLLKEKRV